MFMKRRVANKKTARTQRKPRNKMSKFQKIRIALITTCVIESLILVFMMGVACFLGDKLSMISRQLSVGGMSLSEYLAGETNNPDIQGAVMDPDDIDWGNPANKIGGGKDIINILLIGQDRREGESRARSDSMIICTINRAKNTITMISFMRDMYVQIPGYQDNRINASYAFGGAKLLAKCLYTNFGVVIDGCVEVDFSGFQEVIDTVGGIDIELTKEEADYLNKWGNWDVEDNAGKWKLKAGKNHLNGSQALAYSRIREISNDAGYGDYGRTNRQRTVLTKLMEKAKKLDMIEANAMLDQLLPLIATDLSNKQILNLTMELLPEMSKMKLNSQQIPADGAHQGAYIREMAVLVPDLEKNREILAKIMAE